jgi:hypothetical protein
VLFPFVPGALLSLPALLFYRLKLLQQDFHWTKLSVATLIFLLSTLISFGLFTWILINTVYIMMFDSNPNYDELKMYQVETVNEAWHQTLIPQPFRQTCYSSQEAVCRLAPPYIIKIWDNKIDLYDFIVVFSSLVSGLTSFILAWFMLRRREVHKIE